MIGFPLGRLPSAGDVFPGFFLVQESNARAQHLVDESGNDGLSDRHNLLTVVMHDQFFGKKSNFKKGILKETRKKLI